MRDKDLSEHTRKFLLNMESFYDGYDVEPYTCEVAVSPKILKFFEAKKFFRSQKIEGKFKNGWSRVSYEISSDDMILMLAQRFFPHFVILSPRTARKKFDAQIREYLQNEKLEFDQNLNAFLCSASLVSNGIKFNMINSIYTELA